MSATRPWVDAFADAMERKLAANRHKGDRDGWKDDPAHLLLARLLEEVNEVAGCLVVEEKQKASIYAARWMVQAAVEQLRMFGEFAEAKASNKQIVGECADIANFALMIADVAGGLKPKRSRP